MEAIKLNVIYSVFGNSLALNHLLQASFDVVAILLIIIWEEPFELLQQLGLVTQGVLNFLNKIVWVYLRLGPVELLLVD